MKSLTQIFEEICDTFSFPVERNLKFKKELKSSSLWEDSSAKFDAQKWKNFQTKNSRIKQMYIGEDQYYFPL